MGKNLTRKGLEAFRSEKGGGGAGPRYFGFDIDYIPIETRMKSSWGLA